MVGPAAITLLLFSPAAPVPVGPPAPPVADPAKAAEFGNLVYAAAMQVATQRRDVELPDLAVAAVRGMYEAAGQPAPDDALRAVRDAKRHEERMQLIGEARVRLLGAAALRGPRAYLAAVHGFRHAFDPLSGLAPLHPRSVSVEMDFGLGFELDGAAGQRATAYRLERRIAAGELPPTGLFEPPPRPDAVPSPAFYPWRVRNVVPGSPAHRAGLRPGDMITHMNAEKVTAADADRLFARLAYPPEAVPDRRTGLTATAKFEFRIHHGAALPVSVEMTTESYQVTGVVGCIMRPDGTWDGMLDPTHRIGYVRVGVVEGGSDKAVASVVSELAGRGCRGLVLDLRWCPGGYVTEGTNIAGMFLPAETVIARVELLPKVAGSPAGQYPTVYRAGGEPRFTQLPMVVLVGPETLGGGELIAAALQENGRAVVAGQRTSGRASTMQQLDLGYGGLYFKATYGTSLRPSGKSRQRTPSSAPTDDWGVRPDPGLDVPVTPAVAAEVRAWAEEQALRRAGDRTPFPFDDPDRDPVRAAAIAHLKRHLGPPTPAAQN